MIVELIKLSPGKSIMMVLLVLCIFGVNSPPNDREVEIVETFEKDGKFYNISSDGKLYIRQEKMDVYSWEETTVVWFVSLLGLIIFGALLIVGTVVPDPELNWQWGEVRSNYYYSKIEMYKDSDGNYNYYLNGKLLHRSMQSTTHISLDQYFRNKNILEDYTPIKVKRNNFLKNLLN